MLSDEELEDLLALNHEVRIAEYKAGGSPNDRQFLAKVARACLAMANQRGGGHVTIGIDDSNPLSGPAGLDDADLRDWQDFDTVSARINTYADPPLELEVAVRNHPTGVPVIVIQIAEFQEVPVICKKAFDGVLNLGQLYTRSIAKPESSQYHSHSELREVLDLSTEKGLRTFVERARHAGIELGAGDAEKYIERLGSYLSDSDVREIAAGLNFSMMFRPSGYVDARIPFEELESRIRSVQVRVPAGTFPKMGYDFENSQHAITWRRPVRASSVWRFDESGAFALIQAVRDPGPDFDGVVDTDDPGIDGFVAVGDIVAFVAMSLELAVRLMNTLEINSAECEIKLGGIRGHALVVNDPSRSGLHGRYSYNDDVWSEVVQMSASDRAGGTQFRATEISLAILRRFGWSSVTIDLVTAIQARAMAE